MMEPMMRKILRHWPFERMRLESANPDTLVGVLIITCEREGKYWPVAAFQVPLAGARFSASAFAGQCKGSLGALYVTVADPRERTRILTEVRALIRGK
jgi:hypothetical protein